MKGRWLWIVIGANLLVLVALVFIYPHLMVSPGPLIPGHTALTTDCFACHTPLRGASADRCVTCHAVPDIGLKTTVGVLIQASTAPGKTAQRQSFHQELVEQDCMACHSDHAGPRLTRHSRRPFSHTLLREATRAQCEACHVPPVDALHRTLGASAPGVAGSSAGASVGCAQCHTSVAWKPATFEHAKFFLLDSDHTTSCATCHPGNDVRRYTCYGCHEHTIANIRSKHAEEGVRNIENCVECHRSAHGEPERRPGRGGQGERGRSERD
jgi:hypothetical protein